MFLKKMAKPEISELENEKDEKLFAIMPVKEVFGIFFKN